MAGYGAVEAYGSRGCGRRHVVHTSHKRLVHAIEMCGILCLKIMATFANRLGLLWFSMNSRCTKVTAMVSFSINQTELVYILISYQSFLITFPLSSYQVLLITINLAHICSYLVNHC